MKKLNSELIYENQSLKNTKGPISVGLVDRLIQENERLNKQSSNLQKEVDLLRSSLKDDSTGFENKLLLLINQNQKLFRDLESKSSELQAITEKAEGIRHPSPQPTTRVQDQNSSLKKENIELRKKIDELQKNFGEQQELQFKMRDLELKSWLFQGEKNRFSKDLSSKRDEEFNKWRQTGIRELTRQRATSRPRTAILQDFFQRSKTNKASQPHERKKDEIFGIGEKHETLNSNLARLQDEITPINRVSREQNSSPFFTPKRGVPEFFKIPDSSQETLSRSLRISSSEENTRKLVTEMPRRKDIKKLNGLNINMNLVNERVETITSNILSKIPNVPLSTEQTREEELTRSKNTSPSRNVDLDFEKKLEQRTKDLFDMLKRTEASNSQLKAENAQLRIEATHKDFVIEETKNTLKEKEEQIKNLGDQLKESCQNADNKIQCQKLQAQIDDLTNSLRIKNTEILSLDNKIQAQLKEIEMLGQNYQVETQKLNQIIKDLTERLREKDIEINNMKDICSKYAGVQTLLQAKENEILQLKDTHKELLDNIGDKSACKEELSKQQNEYLKDLLESKEEIIKSLSVDLQKLRKDVENNQLRQQDSDREKHFDYSMQLEELNTEIIHLRDTILIKEKEIHELENKLKNPQIKEKIVEIEKECSHLEVIESLQKQISELEALKLRNSTTIQTLQQEKEELKLSISVEHDSKMGKIGQEVGSRELDCGHAQEIEELRKRIEEMTSLLRQQQHIQSRSEEGVLTENESIKRQLEQFRTENETLVREIDRLNSMISQLQKEKEGISKASKMMEEHSHQKVKMEYDEKLDLLNTQINELIQNNQFLKNESNSKQSSLENAEKIIVDLNQKLDHLNSEKAFAEKQQNEIIQLKQKIEKLETEQMREFELLQDENLALKDKAAENANLKEKISYQDGEIQNLKKELELIRSENVMIKQQVRNEEEKLKKVEQEIQVSPQKLKSISPTKEVRFSPKGGVKKHHDLEEELLKNLEIIRAKDKELEFLRKKVEQEIQFTGELEQLDLILSERTKELENRVKNDQSKHEERYAEILRDKHTLETELRKRSSEIENLTAKLNTLDSEEIQNLRKQLTKTKKLRDSFGFLMIALGVILTGFVFTTLRFNNVQHSK